MNLLSDSLETGSLKIKALASLVSSKSLAAGGCLSEFSLAFLDLCITGVSISSYQDSSHIGLGPTHWNSFELNYLFKSPISQYSYTQRYWKLGLEQLNLVESTISSIANSFC